MSPDEIETLIRRDTNGASGDEARQRRAQLLTEVMASVQHQWYSAPYEVDALAEKLADGSRDDSWRLPLGDAGILDFFLGVIGLPDISQGLKIHTLRLIGNSCADADENRARVVSGNHIPTIMNHLSEPDMLPFAIPVLYNIMVDYEPAQIQGCNAGLSTRLINLLSGPQFVNCQAFINIICKILGLLVSQEPESRLALPQTPLILLTIATNPSVAGDLEDFISLASVALAYLANANFQTELVTAGGMPIFLSVFAMAQTTFDPADVDDPDLVGPLKQLRKALLNSIADLTGLPEFNQACPVDSPVFATLHGWLMGHSPVLQSAACLALGNLCRSDEVSLLLVKNHQIHNRLVALISNPDADTQLLHSTLSFLKNLAIPTRNKPILGEAGLLSPTFLPRIWSLDTNPQVQFAAVSLARLLLVGCSPNVKRLCAPLSPDPQSPAHELTGLSQLIDLYDRSDTEPTKLEAARAVSSVCRVLHSVPVVPILPDWDPKDESYVFKPMDPPPRPVPAPSPSPSSSMPPPPAPPSTHSPISSASSSAPSSPGVTLRERFYNRHQKIMKPLAHLVTQQRFPALRSETWFVLALMARSAEGTFIAMRVFQIHEAFRALMEAVMGRNLIDHDFEGPPPTTAQPAVQPDPHPQVEASPPPPAPAPPATTPAPQGLGHDLLPPGLSSDLGLAPQQQVVEPQASSDMARVDRENCLVLVAELVKKKGDQLPPLRKYYLEVMLREGGQMVAEEKEGKGEGEGGEAGGGRQSKAPVDALMESWAYRDGF